MIVSGNLQGAGVDPGPLFLVPGESEGPGGADTEEQSKDYYLSF
jgi:hypothetical protein